MNRSVQSIFTKENSFAGTTEAVDEATLEEIKVKIGEVEKIKESLVIENSRGPNGVSNWIRRKCREQIADKVHSITEMFLAQGRITWHWKKSNIVPIYKVAMKKTYGTTVQCHLQALLLKYVKR